MLTRLGLVAALVLGLSAPAPSEPAIPPSPSRRVNDYAGVLTTAERERLEQKLVALESCSSNQIVVAVFRSLEGAPLEDYSVRLAQAWRVGQKRLDNGVVFLVFVSDRKMRIEVGYGLEPQLTDAETAAILREAVAPRFRAGRIADGIEAGLDEIAAAIADTSTGAQRPQSSGIPWRDVARHFILWLFLFLLDLVLLVALVRVGEGVLRMRRRLGWGPVFAASGFGLAALSIVSASPWSSERTAASALLGAATPLGFAMGPLILLIILAARARELWAAIRRTWLAGLLAFLLASVLAVALDQAGSMPRWGVLILSVVAQIALWALLAGVAKEIRELRRSREARRKAAVGVAILAGLAALAAVAGPKVLVLGFMAWIFTLVFTGGGSRGTTWSSSRDDSGSSSVRSSSSSSSSSSFSGGGGRFGGGGASGSW